MERLNSIETMALSKQYPQRWIFHEQEIAFDLHEDEESGEVYLVWLDDDVSEEFDDLYEVSEWGMDSPRKVTWSD